MIETTELLSPFSLLWNNLEAHCLHCFHRFTVFTALEQSGSLLLSLFSDRLDYKTVEKK